MSIQAQLLLPSCSLSGVSSESELMPLPSRVQCASAQVGDTFCGMNEVPPITVASVAQATFWMLPFEWEPLSFGRSHSKAQDHQNYHSSSQNAVDIREVFKALFQAINEYLIIRLNQFINCCFLRS